MKRAVRLFAVIALLLPGCAQDDITIIQNNPTETSAPTRHVSMQAAKELLREILPEMTLQTRANFNIGEGLAFDKQRHLLTRAQEGEALYYLFSIDNGRQYAIMSARSELPQLLALGNGTPDAETLEELIPNVEDWSVSTVGYNISINDTGTTIGTITDSTVVVRSKPEFLPVVAGIDTLNYLCPVKWDQNNWFSQFCPYTKKFPEAHANACCVATAIAQLFAIDKCRPAGSATFSIDWDLLMSCPDTATMKLNENAQIHIAELLLELGKEENLNVTYSDDGGYLSTAYPSDVARTLRNFGFKNGGTFVNFTEEGVVNELKRGYPVIIFGFPENPHTGHAWLLEGAKIGMTTVTTYWGAKIIESRIEYDIYFQCNWGCSGAGDGYFHAKGFNPQTGRVYNPGNYPDCPWPMGDLSYGKIINVGVEY